MARFPGRRAVQLLLAHGQTLGWALRCDGPGGHEGQVLAPAPGGEPDKRTGEIIRRYEHDKPGAMIHVDVKKLGNIPDGGGWRYVGRKEGGRNRAATPAKPRSKNREPLIGIAYVHTVIDDHSRVAYAEIHGDETAPTAAAVLKRAVSWFAARGVTVERVLSDNGSAYKSHLWRDTGRELNIKVKKTRPYRPQTNGKIERFHRTLADGWAFKRFYSTESARRNALPAWLHHYNHHRPHPAIGGHPPISRLTNLPRQYGLPMSQDGQVLRDRRRCCFLVAPQVLGRRVGRLSADSHDRE